MVSSLPRSLVVPQAAPAASEYRASLPAIWSALIVVYLIWGSTYLAIRYAVEATPPFLMAAVRFIISGGFLYALCRIKGDSRPETVEWRSAAIIGIFLLVGGNDGVAWAEQSVTSSLAALLVATVPLWMVLIDTFRPAGKRPGLAAVVGILIGFVGVVLLIGAATGGADAEPFRPGGIALRFALMGDGLDLWQERQTSRITTTRDRDANACRRGGIDAFSYRPRRMERLRDSGCFSAVGTRPRLSDRDRFERFCRLRLAFARRPHTAGRDLCLCQSAGCGLARLLSGTGVDDGPYFARRRPHHWLGRAGKHSAKTMTAAYFCSRPCRHPLPMLEERKFHRAGEAMAITLYDAVPSSNSDRTKIALHEKGLGFNRITLDLAKKDQKRPEFLKLNPYGKVPVIDDAVKILFESCIINEYLDEQYPDPSLMPKDPHQRGRGRVLVDYGLNYMHEPYWELRGEMLKKQSERNAAIVEEKHQALRHLLQYLEE